MFKMPVTHLLIQFVMPGISAKQWDPANTVAVCVHSSGEGQLHLCSWKILSHHLDRRQADRVPQRWVTLPLQPLLCTRNVYCTSCTKVQEIIYLLRNHELKIEATSWLHLALQNCKKETAAVFWGVSPGLFSMGPPIFRWGWDAEDQFAKCGLAFPWLNVQRRSAMSTLRSGHAAADTYREKRRCKFLQQKWWDQHTAEKLRRAACPWHPWIQSYKQNEALHEICHSPHELPRVVLKKKHSLEHVMELGIRFSRFPWKIKPALVRFSSPSRVWLKQHFP